MDRSKIFDNYFVITLIITSIVKFHQRIATGIEEF